MSDSPLTELGVHQANQLGGRLSKVDLDVIYSSSSPRAIKTAEIINSRQQSSRPLITEDDFREISLGEWEGMKRSEIDTLYPSLQKLYFTSPGEFQPVGRGESFVEVRERVLTLLHEVLLQNPGKNILVVTHTAIVKLIMGFYEGRTLDRLWDPPHVHPASLSHIAINGSGHQIKKYGDTSHYRRA